MDDLTDKLYNTHSELEKVERHIDEAGILPENKELIHKWIKHSLASGERSIHRTLICAKMLRLFSLNCSKNLANLTRDDINEVMLTLKSKQNQPTINMVIGALRVFYKWHENLESGIVAARIKHLKPKPFVKMMTREALLSEEQVNLMVQHVQKERNGLTFAAMLALQYECALRPGSLRSIQLKGVSKTEYGFKIMVSSAKTKIQPIFSIVSAPLIEKIIAGHEFKSDGDAPLFYTVEDGKPKFIEHIAYTRRVDRTAKKILKKTRCSAYVIRHSRITAWTLVGVQDALLKRLCMHSPTSKATSRYQSLVDSDTENKMLELAGLKPKDVQKGETFVLKKCPKCDASIAPYMQFCPACNAVVDANLAIVNNETKRDEKMQRMEAFLDFIDSQPQMLELLKKMAEEKK